MIVVSVIMPVYNVESHLKRSINYIMNQKFTNWELILVNDGSTDESGKICEHYSLVDDRISVYHQKNYGSGRARQLGLEKSKGKYICFVDPDDYLNTDALNNNVKIIEKYNPDLISNGYCEIKSALGNKNVKVKYQPIIEGFFNKEEFRENFSAYEMIGGRALWNKLYKKSLLIKNNITFTDQRVGQDALFNYEVYKVVNSIYIDPNVYYNYDNTRLGSAVKTYRTDRIDFEYNIAKSYSRLFESWGMKNEYKIDILTSYWNILFTEIVNISKKDCPLSLKEKITRIKHFKKDKMISRALNELSGRDIKSNFSRLNFFLVRRNYITAALCQVRMYVAIRLKS